MKQLILRMSLPILLISSLLTVNSATAQDFKIHSRGMLHETEFNTGEIGRGWVTGQSGDRTNVPLFEWPAHSKTTVKGVTYDGQHNIIGAGVYIGANYEGQSGKDKRVYAFCGGIGGGTGAEAVVNKWVFPLSINRIENFPILNDGSLNASYNPDEAEEIITAKWATILGITVTRTSRAWSYPDYDDLIIYEYEFEYTGDTNGDGIKDTDTKLKDLMICFNYGFAPSMYGYQRKYGTWLYGNPGGMYRSDQNTFWDSDYWLSYNMDMKTESDFFLAGKPEPDKELFKQFARTGENGGGFASPQAPGYAMLYYDLNHLAILDPIDTARNESDFASQLKLSSGKYNDLDSLGRIKQPWSNKVSTGQTGSSKMINNFLNPYDGRYSGVYSTSSGTWPDLPPYGATSDLRWVGRGAFPYRQSADACQKNFVVGPYTIRIGDKVRYAYSEVCGYGADSGKWVEGGQTVTQWFQNPGMNRRVVIDGDTLTKNYLTDFGYPDYVNSSVRTVQDVTKKAFTAYLGQEPTLPVWPETNPATGSYKIPVPCPAPAIKVNNTSTTDIKISWKRTAEDFTHPRLMGKLSKYKLYKSTSGMGPWKLIDTVNVGAVNSANMYEYLDVDNNFKIGESRFYAVTSVDSLGNESGKSNAIQFSKKVGSVDKMGKVYVVPNPFNAKSGFSGEDGKIGFYGLPAKCTIRIFTYAGELVETIEHDDIDSYSNEWFQVSKNRQEIASGIYSYVVTTPSGELFRSKFVVIK